MALAWLSFLGFGGSPLGAAGFLLAGPIRMAPLLVADPCDLDPILDSEPLIGPVPEWAETYA